MPFGDHNVHTILFYLHPVPRSFDHAISDEDDSSSDSDSEQADFFSYSTSTSSSSSSSPSPDTKSNITLASDCSQEPNKKQEEKENEPPRTTTTTTTTIDTSCNFEATFDFLLVCCSFSVLLKFLNSHLLFISIDPPGRIVGHYFQAWGPSVRLSVHPSVRSTIRLSVRPFFQKYQKHPIA